jgi:hypothetical protein
MKLFDFVPEHGNWIQSPLSITSLYLTNSQYNEWILENFVTPLHVNFSLYNELPI